MAYIGNPPAEAYTNTVKDSFDGDGSTVAFTMTQPSATNDVRVVVENVVQDPTVAYTCTGTTLTFTSAPPTGTDNIYVVHMGPAVQTTVPPGEISVATTFASNVTVDGVLTSRDEVIIDGGTGVGSDGVLQVRQNGDGANNGIAITSSATTSHRIWKDSSGSLNIGPTGSPSTIVSDTSGNVGVGTNTMNSLLHLYGAAATLTIDNTTETEGGILFRDGNAGDPDTQAAAIKFDSGSTVSNNALSFYNNDASNLAMRIYNNGAVSRPLQPAFHAKKSSSEIPAVNGDIEFQTELLDNNADYNGTNGRFTAPVDGIYTFTFVLTWASGDGVDDSMGVRFRINGVDYAQYPNDPNYFSRTGVEFSLGGSAVMELDAGDYVTVNLTGVATPRPAGLDADSHFMGHLI